MTKRPLGQNMTTFLMNLKGNEIIKKNDTFTPHSIIFTSTFFSLWFKIATDTRIGHIELTTHFSQ